MRMRIVAALAERGRGESEAALAIHSPMNAGGARSRAGEVGWRTGSFRRCGGETPEDQDSRAIVALVLI